MHSSISGFLLGASPLTERKWDQTLSESHRYLLIWVFYYKSSVMAKNLNWHTNKRLFSALLPLLQWCRCSKWAFNVFLLNLPCGVGHKPVTFDFTAIPTPYCHRSVDVDHESPSCPISWRISLKTIFRTLRNYKKNSYIAQMQDLVKHPGSGWMFHWWLLHWI